MREKATLIALTAILSLVASASRLAAYTETIQVHDDVIYIDANDPNAPQLGDLSSRCPQAVTDLRPMLLFVDGKALDERLYVACFVGGAVKTQELARAKYLEVTQLDNAIFLVGTSGGSTDRGLFVMDFDRGIARQLACSTRIHCLRSVPERGKAMLVHCDLGINEVRYLELDLKTLRLTLSHTFKQAELGDKFAGVCPGTALSPDFRQVAYMAGESWPSTDFQLMLMDLATLEERCIDEHVGIVFSPISSDLGGGPPLDWINAKEIVYRHILLEDINNVTLLADARCVFKRVNVVTDANSVVLDQTLRLGVGAGSLRLNPLNGELIYCGQSIVHLDEPRLTPAIDPFSVVNEYNPDHAKVYLDQQLLQTDAGRTARWTLISARHQCFAWVLHSDHADPGDTVFVKTPTRAGPIEVAQGSSPTTPAGWIE